MSDASDPRGPLLAALQDHYTPAGRSLVVSVVLLVVAGVGLVFYDFFFLLPPGRYSLFTLLVLFVSPVLAAGAVLFIGSVIVLQKLGIAVYKEPGPPQ